MEELLQELEECFYYIDEQLPDIEKQIECLKGECEELLGKFD